MKPGSMLDTMARHAAASRACARREYVQGWCWGLVCGLVTGVCSAALGYWLVTLVVEGLSCPLC